MSQRFQNENPKPVLCAVPQGCAFRMPTENLFSSCFDEFMHLAKIFECSIWHCLQSFSGFFAVFLCGFVSLRCSCISTMHYERSSHDLCAPWVSRFVRSQMRGVLCIYHDSATCMVCICRSRRALPMETASPRQGRRALSVVIAVSLHPRRS